MKRAIIYLRVSTEEQVEEGFGLDAQLEAALRKAREIGAAKTLIFTEAGLSGSLPIDKRPELAKALAAIRRGDTLIVAKRDRLSRSLPIAIAIEEVLKAKRGILISANGEGTGEPENSSTLMQSRISQVFDEVERQRIRERTKAAMAIKKSRMECVGNIQYGFRRAADGVHVEADPEEQGVISTILALRKRGTTFKETVAHLNAANLRTRKGTPWQYRSVWNIAQRVHDQS